MLPPAALKPLFVGAISKSTSPFFFFVHNYFTILSPAAFVQWLKVLNSHVLAVMECPELLIKHVSTPPEKAVCIMRAFQRKSGAMNLVARGLCTEGVSERRLLSCKTPSDPPLRRLQQILF